MTIRNRELSQFGSFLLIDDKGNTIGIATTATPSIGIGTTSSSVKLTVVGDTNIDGNLSVYNGNIESSSFTINGIPLVDASLEYWKLASNDVDLYRNSGNIGIGTSTISEKVTIVGNVSAGQYISTVTTGTAPLVVLSDTQVTNLNASYLRGKIPPSGDIVGNTDTQVLSNKTLVSPILTTPIVGSAGIAISGSTSGTTTIKCFDVASGIVTVPSGNEVLVGRNTTDTFTNKTISASLNTISNLSNSNLSGSAGITNANLQNSTISGVSLGSTLFGLSFGSYLNSSGSYDGSISRIISIAATSVNTANTIVARDETGNFTAADINCSNLSASFNVSGNNLTATFNVSGNNVTATSTLSGSILNANSSIRVGNVVVVDQNRQLNVVGVNTISNVRISSGIITAASSGIVTYYGDGSGLTNLPSSGISTTFGVGSTVWTKPSMGTFALVTLWGGGGSGGKARWSASGGGGAACIQKIYRLSDLPNTVTITVGAGGTGRSSLGIGNSGSPTTFNDTVGGAITAYGGSAGNFTASSSASVTGGGGGGTLSAGSIGVGGDGHGRVNYGGSSTVTGGTSGTSDDADFGGAAGGYVIGTGRSAFPAGRSWWGGGGGGAAADNLSGYSSSLGGVSLNGGKGGDGVNSTTLSGNAGATPGGGGGALVNTASGVGNTSGKGGDGRCTIYIW